MRIRRGACYLLEDETADTAYRLFVRLLAEMGSGFCISRIHPDKVRTRFGLGEVRIGWLAEVPGEDHFSADAMASVARAAQLDIEELGEILGEIPGPMPESTEKTEAPKVLRPVPDMRGPGVHTVRCPKCGTENDDEVAFCVYCGSLLPDHASAPTPAAPAPTAASAFSALRPMPPAARAFPERRPDFVALIGVAFFLLILGVVFTLNTNLLNDFRSWWDLIQPGGLFVRPPDGIVRSGLLFFALLALSNFITSGLRWILDRNRFGALARVLAGLGFVSLAILPWRYSLRAFSGSLVVSIWTALLCALLVISIAVALYWVRARRPAVPGVRAPTSRP